ncbi:MAG: DUF3883 domain-containing protein [Methylococcaceae bacterium]
MEVITKDDLILINELSSRTYSGNRILSNASESEKENLAAVKRKLKNIAEYYSSKYDQAYGVFETSVSTGNDIAIGGTNFKRIWSGIFKGASNKQYAVQISFVMNPNEACLNVGFYFGRASGHSKSKEERVTLEKQLEELASNLSNTIESNELFREKYDSLFDFGFKAYSDAAERQSNEWVKEIKGNAKSSQIFAKIYPNDFDLIEHSTIDSYVAQVIFLMGGVSVEDSSKKVTIKPLSPEQRAKQAERNTEIGLKGELFVMEEEKEKLLSLGMNDHSYPKHVALESMHFGYDILSLDKDGNEIFIEVKTTTRSKNDHHAKTFFMSTNEYKVFTENKNKYKLYRIYDVENCPSSVVLDLNKITKSPDGYICVYQ